MSIRTTITLDDDILERVKDESRSRGKSYKETINGLLRLALLNQEIKTPARKFKITPVHLGYKSGLNHDNIESLLEYGEGDTHL